MHVRDVFLEREGGGIANDMVARAGAENVLPGEEAPPRVENRTVAGVRLLYHERCRGVSDKCNT